MGQLEKYFIMKPRKSGTRHTLLFYRRTMDRVLSLTLLLGIVLLVILIWGNWQVSDHKRTGGDIWLLAGVLVSFGMSLFAFFSRWMAYVQAHQDHLSIVTPFLHLKISYRRIRSIHPSLLQQIFSRDSAKWAETSFLGPFYGKTAIVVETRGYPMDPKLLKMFFPGFMFSPRSPGFVLVVPDWMKFSTEIDTLQGNWLQSQRMKK